MKQVLLATHNKSKIARYKKIKLSKGVEFVTAAELGVIIADISETGSDEWENAKLKARGFYDYSSVISVSQDTGLYINGLPDSEQPAKLVKRIAGVFDNDSQQAVFDKMVKYYTDIAKRFGGEVDAYFLDIYCLYDGSKFYKAEAKRPIIITTNLHHKKDLNFPLCNFYKAGTSGKYYHDLTDFEMESFLEISTTAMRQLIEDYFKV